MTRPPHAITFPRQATKGTVMPRAQSLAAALLCLAFPFALAACGGGGEGIPVKVTFEDVTERDTPSNTQQPAAPATPQPTTPPAMSEPPPATFETLPATRTTAEADHHRVRAAGFEKTLQSAKEAAVSLPRFGSVIQGTDSDADGVTTDRVKTEFDWGLEAELASRSGVLGVQWQNNPEALADSDLTVTITHDNGVRITIDADDATDTHRLPTGTFSIYRPYDQGLRTWYTADHTDTTATFSRVAVATNAIFSNWWVAKGYYLRLAGRNLLSTAPTITAAYMGAFVDGDDLRLRPRSDPGRPYIPPTGTGRYKGLGSGIYTTQYGTGYALPEGSTEFGEFEGTTTLTANFADNTISGCFGCEGDIRLSGVFTNSETAAQGPATNTLSGYQFRLGEAQINPDGTFRANAVTLSNSNLQEGIRITEQGGTWGGRFTRSSLGVAQPRLAAGTFGSQATLSDGSQSAYIGAFIAGNQHPE